MQAIWQDERNELIEKLKTAQWHMVEHEKLPTDSHAKIKEENRKLMLTLDEYKARLRMMEKQLVEERENAILANQEMNAAIQMKEIAETDHRALSKILATSEKNVGLSQNPPMKEECERLKTQIARLKEQYECEKVQRIKTEKELQDVKESWDEEQNWYDADEEYENEEEEEYEEEEREQEQTLIESFVSMRSAELPTESQAAKAEGEPQWPPDLKAYDEYWNKNDSKKTASVNMLPAPTALEKDAKKGTKILHVFHPVGFQIGDLIQIGAGIIVERHHIQGFGSIHLREPLVNTWLRGTPVRVI